MGTFSALLDICAGNSPIPGEFPAQKPLTRSFGVFLDLRLNKRLSKQSWGWWFETPSWSLWRTCWWLGTVMCQDICMQLLLPYYGFCSTPTFKTLTILCKSALEYSVPLGVVFPLSTKTHRFEQPRTCRSDIIFGLCGLNLAKYSLLYVMPLCKCLRSGFHKWWKVLVCLKEWGCLQKNLLSKQFCLNLTVGCELDFNAVTISNMCLWLSCSLNWTTAAWTD